MIKDHGGVHVGNGNGTELLLFVVFNSSDCPLITGKKLSSMQKIFNFKNKYTTITSNLHANYFRIYLNTFW